MVNIDWNKTHVWKKKRKGPVNLLPSRYLACYNALLDLSRGRVHVLGRKRPNTRPYNEPNGLTALVLGPWQCVPKYTMRADWLSRLHIRTHMHVQLNAWSSCRTSLSISALESILYSHALETTPKKKKKLTTKLLAYLVIFICWELHWKKLIIIDVQYWCHFYVSYFLNNRCGYCRLKWKSRQVHRLCYQHPI